STVASTIAGRPNRSPPALRQSTDWAWAVTGHIRTAATVKEDLTISGPPETRPPHSRCERARNTGCRNSPAYRRAERVRPSRGDGIPATEAGPRPGDPGHASAWSGPPL